MNLAANVAVQEATNILTNGRALTCSENLDKLKIQFGAQDWIVDQLLHLYSDLIIEYGLLVGDFNRRGSTTTGALAIISWRTRNLLELHTWIHYCMKSEALAKRFYHDKQRDILDWYHHVHELVKFGGKTNPNLVGTYADTISANRASLIKQGTDMGIKDLGKPYIRITDAATQIGREKEFNLLNKFCSKFVHPTAFTIFSTISIESHEVICPILFGTASALFIEAFNMLDAAIQKKLTPSP